MRILVSAYACEPAKGSEPGVGWHWARELAKEHDVWILTRTNNRPAIDRELAQNPVPRLRVLDTDLPAWMRRMKRGQSGVHFYYYLWQVAALRKAAAAHREFRFELAHHLTFATAFYPALTGTLPTRFVLGPVGGGVRAPLAMCRGMGCPGAPLRAGAVGPALLGSVPRPVHPSELEERRADPRAESRDTRASAGPLPCPSSGVIQRGHRSTRRYPSDTGRR
jgi:hypothetical protein